MKPCSEIEMIPVAHGKELFAREVRRLCSEAKFDCIAVDIPLIFRDRLAEAVDELPLVSALIARDEGAGVSGFAYGDHDAGYDGYGIGGDGYFDGDDSDADGDDGHAGIGVDIYAGGDGSERPDSPPPLYYLPIDPCDAMIEGVRQARQRRVPFYCVGLSALRSPDPMPAMPDEYSIKEIGFDAYTILCRGILGAKGAENFESTWESWRVACRLERLRAMHKNVLAIVHISRFDAIAEDLGLKPPPCEDMLGEPSGAYTVFKRYINPDHLYFAVGELPFVTAKSQLERQNPFALPMDPTDAVKDLFIDTREKYFDSKEQSVHLSPVRIQTALTYLRNLTVMSNRLIPSLFDIVEAAKGVGGNAYALRVLKNAKYYPFLPIDSGASDVVNIGVDKISMAEDSFSGGTNRDVYEAVNLFRDVELVWRKLDIKPDPSALQKKKYRYSWDPYGMCSHIPEDARIEGFNAHVRGKAARVLTEHLARTEKFTSSVKDGIDIRETLRNWHTGSIYVRELPPANNKVDTVIIIFDEERDGLYPDRTTWYAEHREESTLSFYATSPFDDLIGPGVARSTYGGLALLYPPRSVPNIFEVAEAAGIEGCAAQLTVGSLMFGIEKNVAYVAAKAPSLRLRTLSKRFKKHLVWIPLSTFSTETISRLRRFHVLNGRHVRSWASRFIGDEL
ncbi:MAG: hypothetical protein LBH93_06700 [Chitinispirillales bacterium]|jgi:hypothetical protein|nr:hypothetical protein [Chitinispirillales bacterium]